MLVKKRYRSMVSMFSTRFMRFAHSSSCTNPLLGVSRSAGGNGRTHRGRRALARGIETSAVCNACSSDINVPAAKSTRIACERYSNSHSSAELSAALTAAKPAQALKSVRTESSNDEKRSELLADRYLYGMAMPNRRVYPGEITLVNIN